MELKPTQQTSYMANLPIVGGLILFTVILGTTDIGFIPVPTEAKYATSMHLPTIVASLLEGWPAGMIVGTVFGITSMYTSGTPMAQDPIVAMVPRMLVGLTPYFTYVLLSRFNEYVRIGVAAVVGTMTNTVLFLSLSVLLGYMKFGVALKVAWTHGIPESLLAVILVIPGVALLRKLQMYLSQFYR